MKKNDLSWWRDRIDSVDEQILWLLAERNKIAKGIAEVKTRNNMDIFDKNREERVINARLLLATQFGLNKDFIKSLMYLLMEYSKREQREVTHV